MTKIMFRKSFFLPKTEAKGQSSPRTVQIKNTVVQSVALSRYRAMNTEKFCFKWNNFQENVAKSFQYLNTDFCDVTLASEGNQYIEAHKVILAASSPLLRDMLRETKHSHPFLYMRKIKAKDLLNIVAFIYHGEVSVFPEDLDDFLSLAEELELKGLTGSYPSPEEELQKDIRDKQEKKNIHSSINQPLLKENKLILMDLLPEMDENISDSYEGKLEAGVPFEKQEKYIHSEKENLAKEISSLVEKINGIWTCRVCGKVTARNAPSCIARHAEVHIDGVSHTCNQCGTAARSSNALEKHIARHHSMEMFKKKLNLKIDFKQN